MDILRKTIVIGLFSLGANAALAGPFLICETGGNGWGCDIIRTSQNPTQTYWSITNGNIHSAHPITAEGDCLTGQFVTVNADVQYADGSSDLLGAGFQCSSGPQP